MKKNINILKKTIIALVAAGVVLSVQTVPSFAAQTFYEHSSSSKIVKGVSYENKTRITDEGLLNIHIIKIDLENTDIYVAPVFSKKDTGFRETVSKLLESNGAIAGINSAYFGLTGNYSAAFSPQISQGEILSLDADKNIDKNQFGTYFADENGKSYFEYFKTNLDFYADGKNLFEVAGMNTITQMVYPVYIDKNAMENTSKLDERFKEITKIVVEDGKIIKISEKGETVSIPQDGYIIALSSGFANTFLSEFAVGQSAEFKITTSFDTDKIETAVSGGGIILKNGSKPENIGEMASGRHPRTLLGISQDEKTMKLIVAEGKRNGGLATSIGLSVDEAVGLLKEEGVYNGLNLDGGGSSLMAVKKSDENNVSSVSTPAESSERPVVSALGVFDNSEVGEIEELIIKPVAERVLIGDKVSFEVFGYDANYHKIPVSLDDVTILSDETGDIENKSFFARSIGKSEITAVYNNLVSNTYVNVVDVESIIPEKKEINLKTGQSIELKAKGLTADGYEVNLGDKISFEATIGQIEGKIFKADSDGTGYIKCYYDGLESYIKVNVGTITEAAASFEDVKYLDFSSYPADITGIAGISKATYSDGKQGLAISYDFKKADYTQAAYLSFPQAIGISGKPVSLKLDIKGNGTGQWVRAKIIDAKGVEKVIDFSKDVNWTDWKTMTAEIPYDVTYPISVKTIYVASLNSNKAENQVMYFDNLRAEVPVDSNIEMPNDIKRGSHVSGITAGKESGYTYLNFSGNVVGSIADKTLYTNSRVAVNNALGKDSDFAVFAGTNDISAGNKAAVIQGQSSYKVRELDNALLINISAKNGGLLNTQKEQWSWFRFDALNAKSKNVIVFMDKDPNYFTDAKEGELFRNALSEISASGKNVYVLYTNGNGYSSVNKENVRYISLPSLWNGGSLNKEYKVIRIKAGSDSVAVEAIDVFK